MIRTIAVVLGALWLLAGDFAYAQHTDPDGRAHSADFLPAWTSWPIGMEPPDFGVIGLTNTVPSATGCANWPASACPDFYYVDRTHGDATDTSNPNGYPNRPRLTVPSSITPSGNVPVLVQVAGGGYTFGGNVTWTTSGTSDAPIYIVAASGRPDFDGGPSLRTLTINGAYTIVHGFKLTNIRVQNGANCNRIALSYTELTGNTSRGGASYGWNAGCQRTVFYRNWCHHNGPSLPLVLEADNHCAKPSTSTSANLLRAWFINNHVHDQSGDAIQLGSDPADADVSTWPRNIKIVGNVMHTAGENAVDIKASWEVDVGWNDMYDFRAAYGAADPGACIVTHGLDTSPVGSDPASGQGARDVFIHHNRIHHCRVGVAGTGQNGLRVLLNEIYSIAFEDADQPYRFRAGSTTAGAQIHVRANTGSPVIQGNVLYNNPRGINCETNQRCVARDNIVSANTGPSTAFGWESATNASSQLSNNLVHYGAAGMLFGGFANRSHATLGDFNAAPGSTVNCVNCLEGDPKFIDPRARDFRLQATSPAIGTASDDRIAYDDFFAIFGMSIKFDLDGNPIPDMKADIGPHQYAKGRP